MEKKALIAIAFIVIVAFLMNNAPKQTTQQKKLRAQITETFDSPYTDTIKEDSVNYNDSFNEKNEKELDMLSKGFIQKLKRAIRKFPVPRFVGPTTFEETEFNPCATNKKVPTNQIKSRLPFSPSAGNR